MRRRAPRIPTRRKPPRWPGAWCWWPAPTAAWAGKPRWPARLLGRKVPRLKRVDEAVARAGGDAVLYPLDLEGAGPDDYAEMAARIGDAFGALDGLLHCAADMPGLTPLEHTDPAAFARAIHVNLTARWWLTQACLPLMRKAEDAAVVFTVDDPARTSGAYW